MIVCDYFDLYEYVWLDLILIIFDYFWLFIIFSIHIKFDFHYILIIFHYIWFFIIISFHIKLDIDYILIVFSTISFRSCNNVFMLNTITQLLAGGRCHCPHHTISQKEDETESHERNCQRWWQPSSQPLHAIINSKTKTKPNQKFNSKVSKKVVDASVFLFHSPCLS